jgi:glycosyltransferase involved in cell wall biosynthesis
MNIVMITTGMRVELANQSLRSLIRNAVGAIMYTLTIVIDNNYCDDFIQDLRVDFQNLTVSSIFNWHPQGASRSRNIGASSIPKYRRQSHVMFIDDDVYMMPGWDKRLREANRDSIRLMVLSGHAHPYNHTILRDAVTYVETTVISTVHMVMPWPLWDDVGFFVEPGGPGGSEDVDYCRRARDMGYALAVTKPHCVMHCGLTSSSGKQIVGYSEMVAQNERLMRMHDVRDVVWK